ncbi:hypothetical protein MKK70_28390 [Methylobacterium sp. E-041]|jgi:hypothetical protein|uniref:hypothetical protein n=1 Tax=Methylobacterium sp. E-041 TaxID=2836573 RepID=UPI001FB938E8|nr:hypothetical protein [Methylobacterium sp. E-041]MCJ2109214.1 hypothetical protein [Methylobacterium sp. E-041]
MNGIYKESELAGMDAVALCREAATTTLGLNVQLDDGSLIVVTCYAKLDAANLGQAPALAREAAERFESLSRGEQH